MPVKLGRLALGAGPVAALALVLARPVCRVEVGGASMEPTLVPGDRLLAVRTRRVAPGDVVALADPRRPARTVVKRVASLSPEGIEVVGDNPAASTDSRSYGPVPPRHLRGRVVYRYAPEHRRGRLPAGPRPTTPRAGR